MVDEERQLRRWLVWRVLSITGVVLLLAGFVWLWWQGVPALYREAGSGENAENTRLNAVVTTRAALLAGLVGLGALGTFWLNSRVYRITARTFELTERGHLTDRYATAIEQLGNDNLDVRLGGIYSLEQIATDSRRDRDEATIVEVLSAFVRVHSDPLYRYKASLHETSPKLAEPVEEQRREAAKYVAEFRRPPVDVQAAVTVLARLPPREGVSRGDLSDAYLAYADLARANLTEVNLSRANLTATILSDARLTGANFAHANLSGAALVGSDLTNAGFYEANLTETRLFAADLNRANLAKANLTGARFYETDLSGAERLTQEQLDVAIGDGETQLPAGLRRPDHWSPRSPFS